MWPLHDRQRAHTIIQRQGTFVVYLVHQDGQVRVSTIVCKRMSVDSTAASIGYDCRWLGLLVTRVVVFPLGACLVEDEEGPHVCSALQGLSSAVVTASKVQASKMPWTRTLGPNLYFAPPSDLDRLHLSCGAPAR